MAPPISRLWDLATAVLTAVEDGYATEGVDLPDRTFVSYGPPLVDCPLLAVHVERVYGIEGNVAAEALQPIASAAGHTMRAATFVIVLVRCVPVVAEDGLADVRIPTSDEEDNAALEILSDAQLVLNSLVAAERAGDLPGCHSIVYESWIPIVAEGGLAGGATRVRIGVAAGA